MLTKLEKIIACNNNENDLFYEPKPFEISTFGQIYNNISTTFHVQNGLLPS